MFYFLDKNFWKYPSWMVVFLITLTAVIFLRYFIVSILYKFYLEKVTQTQRNSFTANALQIKKEISMALISSLIFAILCALMLWAFQNNLTVIYHDVHTYPVIYFWISPVMILLVYETYYYWLHRWLHRPAIFKIIHRAHHASRLPTVFTAFSFHPLEAFLQFIFFPAYLIIIPMHPIMLGVVFMFLTATAMINHGGVELYGKNRQHPHLIGSSHHDVHHKHFKSNFGLNFTWWDKWMKTEKTD